MLGAAAITTIITGGCRGRRGPHVYHILLAAALQHWERYSAHALAARAVAATLAKGTANHLDVLSVYGRRQPIVRDGPRLPGYV